MKLLKFIIIAIILGVMIIPGLKYRFTPQTFNGYKEVLGKRTETSQTFQVDNDTFIVKIYAEPAESKFGLVKHALADTIFAGAGDGYVEKNDNSDWIVTRTAASGSVVSSTDVTAVVGTGAALISGNYDIRRAFIPFNTSSIPTNSRIDSASLNIYVTVTSDGDNDGDDFINVVQSNQADSTTLAVGDYSKDGTLNSPSLGSTSKDLSTDFTTNAYNTFTLNSTGLTWIVTDGANSNCGTTRGVTCLGLREGHDINNNEFSGFGGNTATFSTSEQSGTSQDPYLLVTYSFITSSVLLNSNAVLQTNAKI